MMSAEIWTRSRTPTGNGWDSVSCPASGTRTEILSTSGGEYVIVDCCNDPQKLKAIQRRIQAQMNGLDVSAGKVHGRVHFLERFMGWVRKERSDGAA
jgi:hypothetical protein